MANVREFPLTALYRAARDGDIERPVQLCASFASKERVYIFKLFMPIAS